jgi:hypothetical protein
LSVHSPLAVILSAPKNLTQPHSPQQNLVRAARNEIGGARRNDARGARNVLWPTKGGHEGRQRGARAPGIVVFRASQHLRADAHLY